ncbi:MAG: alpha-amylase family glycosyl hydrolase, partial [Chthoniobacteraceae bacterium]
MNRTQGFRQSTPGTHVVEEGVHYQVWAPKRKKVEAEITGAAGPRTLVLTRDAQGFYSGIDRQGRAGDRYRYRLDGSGPFPDPASRWQPEGVHGPSQVIDPRSYAWNDGDWQRPRFRDLVLYEIHIGTFTREGTFRSTMNSLPYLRDLGINAIQIMPVADFPGERNWGYDGVNLFAPARCYGHPDDLRALVDAAHQQGIAVIQDVVYNHFGPDGNYLSQFSPHYFTRKHKTPWGDALNVDDQGSEAVRAFFIANAAMWMNEFHMDG